VHIDFNPSERSTLGIEMELEVVDRTSRELVSVASEVLAELSSGPGEADHPKVKHELFECTLEVITGICDTVAEARADLEVTVNEVRAHTDPRGLALMCSGSHPFSDWRAQRISPDPRYHRLVEEMQWLARRMQIFGVHFHVGVRSQEKVIAIANGLTAYLPHFLALSASSPFWAGYDTGMASSRTTVFENLPTAGLPYRLSGWDEFELFMQTLIAAGAVSSIREVWWDIRPHPDFGTVELRMCDGIPTMGEVAACAALAQCLVERMDSGLDAGHLPEAPRQWVMRTNKWRAARHGLEARVITDAEGTTVGLREDIARLVDELAPVAAELGCAAELRSVLTILESGPSYARQRAVREAGGTLAQVVDSLVADLERVGGLEPR